jgi:hypothetical protein
MAAEHPARCRPFHSFFHRSETCPSRAEESDRIKLGAALPNIPEI